MNYFFNKGLLMVGVASFILPFSSLTVQARETTIALIQETQTDVSPFWVYDHVQTITLTFPTASLIPKEVPYEYYHEVYGVMRGLLKYVKHEYIKGEYKATFTGKMYSNPL
ncbi:hypothetical protein ACIP9C_17700 [Lysinibacillus sp. NPDC093210]|uniref:hypothetical protein n=1 Tax=Lysinibacillus sp. NPDC093210 TaxID=3364133 RepID=UPI0037F964A9